VPEPSAFEVERATEELKRHKSPGTDQIPIEFLKVGGRTTRSKIHIGEKRVAGTVTVIYIFSFFCAITRF